MGLIPSKVSPNVIIDHYGRISEVKPKVEYLGGIIQINPSPPVVRKQYVTGDIENQQYQTPRHPRRGSC